MGRFTHPAAMTVCRLVDLFLHDPIGQAKGAYAPLEKPVMARVSLCVRAAARYYLAIRHIMTVL